MKSFKGIFDVKQGATKVRRNLSFYSLVSRNLKKKRLDRIKLKNHSKLMEALEEIDKFEKDFLSSGQSSENLIKSMNSEQTSLVRENEERKKMEERFLSLTVIENCDRGKNSSQVKSRYIGHILGCRETVTVNGVCLLCSNL